VPSTFLHNAGFVGTDFGEDTQVSFGIFRILQMSGIGVASLLAFMPLKIYQIILCTSLIVFVCLHLIVKRVATEKENLNSI